MELCVDSSAVIMSIRRPLQQNWEVKIVIPIIRLTRHQTSWLTWDVLMTLVLFFLRCLS